MLRSPGTTGPIEPLESGRPASSEREVAWSAWCDCNSTECVEDLLVDCHGVRCDGAGDLVVQKFKLLLEREKSPS